MSIRDEMKKKYKEGPPLLHGEDLPPKKNSVTITVKELRAAPDQFQSIAIIDLATPVYGKESWAVNKTNINALLAKLEMDDSADFADLNRALAGKKLTLAKVMVNDPKRKKPVPSLFIA